MKTRGPKIEDCGWQARSVLECGSPLPLLGGGAGFDLGDIRPNEQSSSCESARGLAHSKTWRRFVASLVFLASAIVAYAQSYSIDWFTINGGGGTSTGGVYSVSGTIGQPDAGTSSGGNYSLIGGFWGAVIPVQTPGAPTLFITPTETNVTISWLPNTPGFVLQQVSALTPVPIGWANAPAGYTNGVTIPAAPQTRYFRLIKP